MVLMRCAAAAALAATVGCLPKTTALSAPPDATVALAVLRSPMK